MSISLVHVDQNLNVCPIKIVDPSVLLVALILQDGNPQYLRMFHKKSLPLCLTALDTILYTSIQQSCGKTNGKTGETEDKNATREKKENAVLLLSSKIMICSIITTMFDVEEKT
jgi:hypothetical protein